jgi:hypothetical protein
MMQVSTKKGHQTRLISRLQQGANLLEIGFAQKGIAAAAVPKPRAADRQTQAIARAPEQNTEGAVAKGDARVGPRKWKGPGKRGNKRVHPPLLPKSNQNEKTKG